MYKVFVDNVPIYFQKNSSLESNLPKKLFPTILLHDFDAFVHEVNRLNSDTDIFVNSPDPLQEIKRFFKHFKWIEAAGGIVKNTKTDELLFIFRNGIWDIPKGKIEKGEEPHEAALREINEECGLDNIKIDKELIPTYHVYFAYGKHWIKKTFWFTLSSPLTDIQPQKEEGITEVKWFQKNELETIQKNTYGSILDVLADYLKGSK